MCFCVAAQSHVKHRFSDTDAKGNATCKFLCHSYWATQFRVRRGKRQKNKQTEKAEKESEHGRQRGRRKELLRDRESAVQRTSTLHGTKNNLSFLGVHVSHIKGGKRIRCCRKPERGVVSVRSDAAAATLWVTR